MPGHSLLFYFRPKGLVGLKDGSSVLVFSAFGDVVVDPDSLGKFPFQDIISYPELLNFLENLLKPI